MTSETTTVQGVKVPRFLYGTAWKEERTAHLVEQALVAGFRGIDTANQRKHYHEAGVGSAIARSIARGLVTRGELFLQTKFTYVEGQDARLPYDPAASYAAQVRQSFTSSLEHLGVEAIDPDRHYARWRAHRMDLVRNVGMDRRAWLPLAHEGTNKPREPMDGHAEACGRQSCCSHSAIGVQPRWRKAGHGEQ